MNGDPSVLTDSDLVLYESSLSDVADPIRARLDWMCAVGILEICPEDRDKPWSERRLRRTSKGEAFFGPQQEEGEHV